MGKRVLWFQKLAIGALYIAFKIYYRMNVKGRKNIPDQGCIICSNHSDLVDPPILAASVGTKRPIAVIAKRELFEKQPLKLLLEALGAFPVNRGSADLSAIKTAFKAIEQGDNFVIFPEGTRSMGNNFDAKAGAGMFALRTKRKVLPVYISKNKSFRSRVDVVIGEPFYPTVAEKKGTSAYIKASEQILQRIYGLEEYMDAFKY